MSEENRLYKIGQLAQLYGVSTDILRHYDRIGLLKPSKIAENGYRYYGVEAFLSLDMILTCRSLDMPLEDIKALLTTKTQCAQAIDKALAKQEDALAAQIQKLQNMQRRTRRYRAYLKEPETQDISWRLGMSRPVKCMELSDGIYDLPVDQDIQHLKRALSDRWNQEISHGYETHIQYLYEGKQYFDSGSIQLVIDGSSDFPGFIPYPEELALCGHFYGSESDLEGFVKAGMEILKRDQLKPRGPILEVDHFIWWEGNELWLNADLYIFLSDQA